MGQAKTLRCLEDLTSILPDEDDDQDYLKPRLVALSRLLEPHAQHIELDLKDHPPKTIMELATVPSAPLALAALWPLLSFTMEARQNIYDYQVQALKIRIGSEVVKFAKRFHGIKIRWLEDQRARAGQHLINSVARHGYFVIVDGVPQIAP